jgi:hypothetical protein
MSGFEDDVVFFHRKSPDGDLKITKMVTPTGATTSILYLVQIFKPGNKGVKSSTHYSEEQFAALGDHFKHGATE